VLNALALCEILTVPTFWYHGSSLLYLSLSSHPLSHIARFVSAEFVRDGAALGLAEMVRGGTTCVNDMYFFNDALLVAARAAGVRLTAGLVLLDFPTAYAPTGPDEYLAKADALVKANAASDASLIRCAMLRCFSKRAPNGAD
jgi:cytosine/adenosine deaminase-related metal-dependent hydrolase